MTDCFIYDKICLKEFRGNTIKMEQPVNHNLIEYILSKPFLSDSENIQLTNDIMHFLNEMPGGFLIYHADGEEEIIYANNALLRFFQCDTLDEFRAFTNNSFKGIVHPEDLEDVEKSIWKQIADNQYDLDYVEYRIIRKDGTIRWIEDYGHFIHSNVFGDIFYVFLGDATEKRERQLAEKTVLLEEHEQKIQNLIKAYDKERKIVDQEQLRRLEVIEGLSVNYESILYADLDKNQLLPYRLSGRTERQFEKKFQIREFTWYTIDYVDTWVLPEDRELVRKSTSPEYIRRKLSEDKTFYINYRILYHGKIQHLQLRIVNVGNKEHISQIVMGYRRIDEEILHEMEQKEALEEALQNAKSAIVAKNTFLSNMSHDMRTPLNAILGFTSLAKNDPDNIEKIQDYLNKIETSSVQLLELIDKVLEISWAESNDISIVETECNLHDILQDVQNSLLTAAHRKNITFTMDDTEVEHYDIYSDAKKLKQVLRHLADNAITYTKNNGAVTITVKETKKLSNDYGIYQFVVTDTGIGIDNHFQKNMFEPFEREKNTTFSGIHGSGLGLTITKNIIEKMNGTIEVSSVVEEGSTFIVTLHLRIQNQDFSFSNNKEEILAQVMSRKILLVEDNEINLEIETELLQALGFHIDTATDGHIAVDKITASKPEEYAVILMDIQMPVMNGWEATEAIRKLADPVLSHIPIIALSANAFESDKRISTECGMDAHLTKPIDVPLLLDTIAKTIQTHNELFGTTI